ncbi:MAG: PHP domain-containing protein [Candidatus Peribacteria bacterium]|nr:MAG: PHP domain-containing protein [Candidatus Peribacteria bacterium]
MFTHLHGHSHYSLLEALGTPGAIVSSIKGHGMTAAALTDYNGMYGAIEFYQACLKAEIKPIL